ncbi:hypothetical protein UGMREWDR_CDS0075 [Aeromonas phage GomatiRiver_11]|nr:hypothetical protein OBDJBBDK_00069 [Aeromonas phage AhFM11]WKW84242.1 hypothetical protein UGMREWDR_CDS0075 [Aeromonas phage GomatiRiver_11]
MKIGFKTAEDKAEFLIKGNKGDKRYNAMVAKAIEKGTTATDIGDFYDLDAKSPQSGLGLFIQKMDFKHFKLG